MSTERAGTLGVAVVVPVFRDTESVRALLAAMDAWTPPPQEVVVASGESDAALAELCRERGCSYIEAPRNRGAQLDLGAREARASVLWFLHADVVAPRQGIGAIRRAIEGGAESGCFRLAFQGRPAWHKSLLAALIALRVRAGGTAYGDQALFATREAYDECEGFAHQPLFEEARLVRRLRRRGTFSLLPESVGVSTRRWERDGWLRRTLHNRWLALCYMLGVPAERLAGAYGPLDNAERKRPGADEVSDRS